MEPWLEGGGVEPGQEAARGAGDGDIDGRAGWRQRRGAVDGHAGDGRVAGGRRSGDPGRVTMGIDAGDPAGQVRWCCAGHGEPEVHRPVRSCGQRCGDLHCLVVRGPVRLPLGSAVEHPPPHRADRRVGVPAHQDRPARTSDRQGFAWRQDGRQRRREGARTIGERRWPVIGVKRPAPVAASPGVRDNAEPGLGADPGRDQHRVRGSDHGGAVVDEQLPAYQMRGQVDLRPPADPAERLRPLQGDGRVLRVPGETGPLDRCPWTARRELPAPAICALDAGMKTQEPSTIPTAATAPVPPLAIQPRAGRAGLLAAPAPGSRNRRSQPVMTLRPSRHRHDRPR